MLFSASIRSAFSFPAHERHPIDFDTRPAFHIADAAEHQRRQSGAGGRKLFRQLRNLGISASVSGTMARCQLVKHQCPRADHGVEDFAASRKAVSPVCGQGQSKIQS